MEQNLLFENDKLFLESNYTTGNKAYCAFITGLDQKYKYKRVFINSTRKGYKIVEVKDGDIIEESVSSHSGKNTTRYYYKVVNGQLTHITEREIHILFS